MDKEDLFLTLSREVGGDDLSQPWMQKIHLRREVLNRLHFAMDVSHIVKTDERTALLKILQYLVENMRTENFESHVDILRSSVLRNGFLKFPTDTKSMEATADGFQKKFGISNCIGSISSVSWLTPTYDYNINRNKYPYYLVIVDADCMILDLLVGTSFHNGITNEMLDKSEYLVALKKYNSWVNLYKERLQNVGKTLKGLDLSEEQKKKVTTMFPGLKDKEMGQTNDPNSDASEPEAALNPFYFVAGAGNKFPQWEHLRVVSSNDAEGLKKALEPAEKVVRMLRESFNVVAGTFNPELITSVVLLHNFFMKHNPVYAEKCLNI